jgi:RNA polymerase sigma factor (sigma-70 family)
METARARQGGRRHNLSLRQLGAIRGRRDPTDRAFESFYRKHVAEVYQYALAVLANPTDAEDVTQQTFLNAYKAFQSGERPHTPHNWLIKIAHNVCRMRWRQSTRRPQEVPLESVPEPAGLDEKPSLDEVLGALARLPFNQRAAVVMREVEGRTYAEIADVLNTTVPAVEALLFRARTNLKSRRKALDVLTLAPLPGSLSSFFGGGGGGAVAAGGAAVGTEIVLKAVAIVATGVVAGGLGFKTVKAVAKPDAAPALQVAPHYGQPSWSDPVQRIVQSQLAAHPELARFVHARRANARLAKGRLERIPIGDSLVGPISIADPAAPGGAAGTPAAAAAAAAAPATVQAASGAVAGAVGSTTAPVTHAVGTVAGAVPLPPPPQVTVPSATVTVTPPSLPPPPPLPVTVPPPPSLPSVTVTTPTVPKLP